MAATLHLLAGPTLCSGLRTSLKTGGLLTGDRERFHPPIARFTAALRFLTLTITMARLSSPSLTMDVDNVDAATLMPLETPVLKVSRPVAACSRCRNAKIKCDGKLPVCLVKHRDLSPCLLTYVPGMHLLREEWQSRGVHQYE